MPSASFTRSIKATLSANVAPYVEAMRTAQQKTSELSQEMRKASGSQEWSKLGSTLAGIGAVGLGAIALMVKASMDFDKAMSKVAASGDDAAKNLGVLREAAIRAGADTQFSAVEAAEGIEALAKAGVSAKDIIGGGLTGALNLAASGNMSVADSAETVAIAMAQFKLDGTSAAHVADLLAAGAGKAVGEVSDFAAALKQGGMVASQMGLSLEETTGGLAAFAQAGLRGSDAGTSLKTMLQRLADPSKESATKMSELGINTFDAQGKFIGLAGVAGQLREKMSGLTDQQRNQALATIFGSDAVRAAAVLYDNGAEGIRKWTAEVNDAGYAAEAAARKNDNLAGDVERLMGSLETAAINGGSGFAQSLRGIVQWADKAVDAISKIPKPAMDVMVGLAAFGSVAALAGGGAMKMVTSLMQAKEAFGQLAVNSPKAAGALFKIAAGGTAVVASLAAIGLVWEIGKRIDSELRGPLPTIEKFAGALARLANSGDMSQINQMFAQGNQSHDMWAQSLGDALRTMDDASHGIGSLRASIQGLVGTGDIDDASKKFANLDKALKGLDGASAGKAFSQVAAEAEKVKMPVDKLVALFPEYAASIQSQANAAGRGALSNDELAAAMKRGGLTAQENSAAIEKKTSAALGSVAGMYAAQKASDDLTNSASEEAKAMRDGISVMIAKGNAALQLSGSELGVKSAQDAATKAAQDNAAAVRGGASALNINSAAGAAMREKLDALASSQLRHTDAMMKSDAPAEEVYVNQRAQASAFLTTATQMGMNAQKALDLAEKYKLIPPNVNTNALLADLASGKINGIQGLLRILDNTDPIPAVYLNDQASGPAANIRNQIALIPSSKQINVNTVYTESGRKNGLGVSAATGGHITGPGTATSDSIPAWLSNGEYVIRAAAVAKYGLGMMHALNAGHFADGGLIGSARFVEPQRFADGGQPQPVPHWVTQSGPSTVLNVTSHNYAVDPSAIAHETTRQLAFATRG